MIADIDVSGHLRRDVGYNERKVKSGAAVCIFAGNFLKEAHEMTRAEKIQRFVDQIALHDRKKTSTLHIYLGFSIRDIISKDKLICISREYMERIGLGDHPFIVYQHLDAAHPHVHIVTISIRHDGTRINLHHFGAKRSAPACRLINEKYGLQKADKAIERKEDPFPEHPEKLIYGKKPVKEAITQVLNYVLHNYKYRDVDELNAILRLYNLSALPGKTGGWLAAHHGLLYWMLDEQGKGIGMPIKASAIPFKPTLKWLATRFGTQPGLDHVVIQRVQSSITAALAKGVQNWQQLTSVLRQDQIAIVPVPAAAGAPGEWHYIDLATKAVVKGGELGTDYTPDAVMKRMALNTGRTQNELDQKTGHKISQHKL
jgi:hypothetical protein